MAKKIDKRKNRSKKKKILTIVGLFVSTGLFLLGVALLGEDKVQGVKKKFGLDEVVTYSVGRPSEKEIGEYEVPPYMPRKITLQSIHTSGYIQMVGIDQNNDISVPTNVLMAGWYVNSVRPGDEGLSIITGHRDGIMKKGIFRHLNDLKKGDKFEVQYGDRSVRNFKVRDIQIMPSEEAHEVLYEHREDIEKQLNLVSCIGTYIRYLQTYDKRIILITEGID